MNKRIRVSSPLSILGGLWLVSALYLLTQGHALRVALATAAFLFWGAHTWLSVRLTAPQPTAATPPQRPTRQLWWQIAVILLFIAIANQALPGWGVMIDALRSLGEATLPAAWVGGPGNAVANPVQYFVLPLLALLWLGAKPAELGLQWGYRSWRICGLFLLIPTVTWLVLIRVGAMPVQTVVRRLVGNALQNGFFEEFLFRGALQSRLQQCLSNHGTLVLQALLFGLWHLAANGRMFAGDWLAALAWCIVSQAMIGLLFGLLFQRTQSLLAPSVAHVVSNAFGQTFG